jgi:Escherichia/Staphylococcus phage prohead protease
MPHEMKPTVGTRELRFAQVGSAAIATRAADDQAPMIEGHGALFNTETVIGGYFREVIAPGAFKESIAKDDIRVAFNHSANAILGRTSAKTATVEEDSKGLKYTAIPPDTTAGRDTVVSIKRGDVTGSSFQFEIENDDDETWDYEQTKKGMLPLRTIKRAKLWEVGPVAWPAYESTTVSARAVAHVEEARAAVAAAQAAAPAETPAPVVTPVAEEAPAVVAAVPAAEPTESATAAPESARSATWPPAMNELEDELNRLALDS